MQCKIFKNSLISLVSLTTFSLWSAAPERPFWELSPSTETVGIVELIEKIKEKRGIPAQGTTQPSSTSSSGKTEAKKILNSHNTTHYSIESLEQKKEDLGQALTDAPQEVKTILNIYKSNLYKGKLLDLNRLFLFGEAGTGKTTLGIAAALFLKRPCILVDCANTATKYKASGPENLRNVLFPLIEESQAPYVIIFDEVTTLTNGKGEQSEGKESAAGVWKIVDRCFEASHLFLVFTTNYVKDMPQPLKSRFLNSAVEISTPSNQKFVITLISLCRKNGAVITPEVESQLMKDKKFTLCSFRDVEAFAIKLLMEAMQEPGNNNSVLLNNQNENGIMLSKEFIDSKWNKLKQLMEKMDYNKPDVSENERLHKDNQKFQLEVIKKQEEFQLLAQERQEMFANNQATENMIMQSTSSVPLVGSIVGSLARNSYVASRKKINKWGNDIGTDKLKSDHQIIKDKQTKHTEREN